MLNTIKRLCLACVLIFLACSAPHAKVTSQEAEKLGKELTPLGGNASANAENTIPAYTGGITAPPKGYNNAEGYIDPYADDDILFTITQQTISQHKDKLSPGQLALFRAHPDTFKMHVYPTRRSAAFPSFIYEAVKKNAVNAQVDPKTYNITGWTVAYPFPIPKTGLEAIMNVVTSFSAPDTSFYSCQAITNRDGDFSLIKFFEEALNFDTRPNVTPEPSKHLVFKQTILAPPREAGRVLLVHIPSDKVTYPQNAWIYNPGQRRVRRAPAIKYDGPGSSSDGLRTTDDYGVFNGAPDKYEWTLKGKKELYVPYNSYTLIDRNLKYKTILHKGHINPELVRCELHRVWVLEANLKPTMRHIYKKRVLYLDEDSWVPLMANSYDNRGQLWRVIIGHPYNAYTIPTPGLQVNVYHDLQSGRYLVQNLKNEERGNTDYDADLQEKDFTPSALRRAGRR